MLLGVSTFPEGDHTRQSRGDADRLGRSCIGLSSYVSSQAALLAFGATGDTFVPTKSLKNLAAAKARGSCIPPSTKILPTKSYLRLMMVNYDVF